MVSRFGISRGVSPRESFQQVGEIAKAIEDHGFENVWYVDHQLGMKDIYAAMYVSALNTKRIEIGAAVTNLKTRHPTVTANATTALDEISDGRAVLGLGSGWIAVYSIGQKPSKLAETREGIRLIKQLFAGEEVEIGGTKAQLATARREIPIYLAVSQPGMLRIAGELCDGAILMGAADADIINYQLEFIYEGLETAGRKRDDIVIDMIATTSIDEDERKAINDVRSWATTQAATFTEWKQLPEAWEKFRPEFEHARNSYHFKDHLSLRAEHQQQVSAAWVQTVAVAGNLETCVDRLRALGTLDIDRFSFPLLSGGRLRRLGELANDLIPKLVAA